jgi:hypothetical protein
MPQIECGWIDDFSHNAQKDELLSDSDSDTLIYSTYNYLYSENSEDSKSNHHRT